MTPTQRLSTAIKNRDFGCHHRHTNTTGAILRELDRLAPEHIIIAVDGRVTEVTVFTLGEVLLGLGYGLHSTCPLDISIPRAGWVVLIPRRTESHRLRFNIDRPIQIKPRRTA